MVMRYTTFAAYILLATVSMSQSPQWGFTLDSPGYDQAEFLGVDADGNVVVVGELGDVLDADPGTDEFLLDPGADEAWFVAKYTATGDFLWAFPLHASAGVSDQLQIHDVAVSPDGAVHLFFTLWGSVDLDPSGAAQVVQATTLDPVNQEVHDLVLVTYTTDGNYAWHKHLSGGVAGLSGRNVMLRTNGSVLIAGGYNRDIDLDQELNSSADSLHAVIQFNAQTFLAQYTSSGVFEWAADLDTESYLQHAMVSSSDGIALAVTGPGALDLDPGPGVEEVTATSGTTYIIQLAPTLELVSSFALVGMYGVGIAVMVGTAGRLFVVGSYEDQIVIGDSIFHDSNTGPTNDFLACIPLNGAAYWAVNLNIPVGSNESLAVDASGAPVLGFEVNDPVDLDATGTDPAAVLDPIGPTGDIGVASYDAMDGTFRYAWHVGDAQGELFLNDIALDDADHILLAGQMVGTVDFDPGPGEFPLAVPTTLDELDGAFVVRYDAVYTGLVGTPTARDGMQVFPNPAHDVLQLDMPPDGATNLAYVVYDGTGRAVEHGSTRPGMSRSISVHALQPGFYSIRVVTDQGIVAVPFLKE